MKKLLSLVLLVVFVLVLSGCDEEPTNAPIFEGDTIYEFDDTNYYTKEEVNLLEQRIEELEYNTAIEERITYNFDTENYIEVTYELYRGTYTTLTFGGCIDSCEVVDLVLTFDDADSFDIWWDYQVNFYREELGGE